MLLATRDEAYIDSTIGDGEADSESEDNDQITSHPLSLALLKDENDGLLYGNITFLFYFLLIDDVIISFIINKFLINDITATLDFSCNGINITCSK